MGEIREAWDPVLRRIIAIKSLRRLQRVCEAMAYAHDKGVVHRDLKPANIMVGRYGEVHVLDRGVARIIGSEEDRRQGLRKTAPITQPRSANARAPTPS